MRWLALPITAPRWAAATVALCLLGLGAALGIRLTAADGHPGDGVLRGVVDSVDDDGALCIGGSGRAGEVECYQAPGVGLEVGDAIRFRLREESIDPDDPDVGNQLVMVWVARE